MKPIKILRSTEGCRVGANVWTAQTADAVAQALRDAADAMARGGIARPHIRQCGHVAVGFTAQIVKVTASGELVAVLNPGEARKLADELEGKV